MKPVYLAAPLFTVPDNWLLDEVIDFFDAQRIPVFSPRDDVGLLVASGSQHSAADIAAADLRGLDSCASVLALLTQLDAGTLVEIGYALGRGMPVVVYSRGLAEKDLTMLHAEGCSFTDSLASALYSVCWKAME